MTVCSGAGDAVGGVFLASLALGSTPVPLRRVVAALLAASLASDDASVIVVHHSGCRARSTAMLAGAALGIAGLQMQTLFRNPLADPFALGISSGASLGVALVRARHWLRRDGGVRHGDGDARRCARDGGGDCRRGLVVLGLVLIVSSRIANPTTVLILGLDVRLRRVGGRHGAGRRQCSPNGCSSGRSGDSDRSRA